MSKLTVVTINFCLDMTDPKSDSAYVGTLVVDEASREAAIAWRALSLDTVTKQVTTGIGVSLHTRLAHYGPKKGGPDDLQRYLAEGLKYSSIFFDFSTLDLVGPNAGLRAAPLSRVTYWSTLAEDPERWMIFNY